MSENDSNRIQPENETGERAGETDERVGESDTGANEADTAVADSENLDKKRETVKRLLAASQEKIDDVLSGDPEEYLQQFKQHVNHW
jgi:hypothetical protein